MLFLQQLAQVGHLCRNTLVVKELFLNDVLMFNQAFPVDILLHRSQVQLGKQHLFGFPSHAERLSVHETVIVVVFNHLDVKQDVRVVDQPAPDIIPLVPLVVEKVQVVIADVVVIVVDKQVREQKQQHLVFLIKVEPLQFLDENQVLVAVEQVAEFSFCGIGAQLVVVAHFHDIVDEAKQLGTSQAGEILRHEFLVVLKCIDYLQGHMVGDAATGTAAVHQATAFQLVHVLHETDDACGAALEVFGEITDADGVVALVDKQRHHHRLFLGEFHLVLKVLDGSSRLAVKLRVQL